MADCTRAVHVCGSVHTEDLEGPRQGVFSADVRSVLFRSRFPAPEMSGLGPL